MSNKLAIPMKAGVLFLRLPGCWPQSRENSRKAMEQVNAELQRAFDEARREGRPAAILLGKQVEVLYIGPDGHAEKLEAK